MDLSETSTSVVSDAPRTAVKLSTGVWQSRIAHVYDIVPMHFLTLRFVPVPAYYSLYSTAPLLLHTGHVA